MQDKIRYKKKLEPERLRPYYIQITDLNEI